MSNDKTNEQNFNDGKAAGQSGGGLRKPGANESKESFNAYEAGYHQGKKK